MANPSILAAFERMWQHVVIALNDKATISYVDEQTTAISNEEIDALCANTLPEESLTESQIDELYNKII